MGSWWPMSEKVRAYYTECSRKAVEAERLRKREKREMSDGQESRANVFYQGEQCEVVEVHWTTSHGVFSPNTLLGLQNKKGERWSVVLAELDLFNLGTFADDHTGKPAESDTSECEGHIYGYGREWNSPAGWLCDDMDGASAQEMEEFAFCPRCGRDLRPDWAAFRAQKEQEP